MYNYFRFIIRYISFRYNMTPNDTGIITAKQLYHENMGTAVRLSYLHQLQTDVVIIMSFLVLCMLL